jgi:hypothetical protein
MPNSRKPVRRKAPTGKRLRRPLDKRSTALEDLAATLQSSRIVVVYVSPGGPPDPDLVLPMFSLFGRTVWVDISKYVGPPAAFWTQVLNAQLGHVSREIRPGYYLFIDSTACAYQSGLIDFKRDQLAVGVGAFAAAIGLLDDRPSWAQAGATVIGAAAAWRVFSAFMAVIAERNGATAPPQPPRRTGRHRTDRLNEPRRHHRVRRHHHQHRPRRRSMKSRSRSRRWASRRARPTPKSKRAIATSRSDGILIGPSDITRMPATQACAWHRSTLPIPSSAPRVAGDRLRCTNISPAAIPRVPCSRSPHWTVAAIAAIER